MKLKLLTPDSYKYKQSYRKRRSTIALAGTIIGCLGSFIPRNFIPLPFQKPPSPPIGLPLPNRTTGRPFLEKQQTSPKPTFLSILSSTFLTPHKGGKRDLTSNRIPRSSKLVEPQRIATNIKTNNSRHRIPQDPDSLKPGEAKKIQANMDIYIENNVALFDNPIRLLFSPKQKRVKQTASIIQDMLENELNLSIERIIDTNFSAFETGNLTYTNEIDRDTIIQKPQTPWGPGAESLEQFIERIKNAFSQLPPPDDTTTDIVVASSSVILLIELGMLSDKPLSSSDIQTYLHKLLDLNEPEKGRPLTLFIDGRHIIAIRHGATNNVNP